MGAGAVPVSDPSPSRATRERLAPLYEQGTRPVTIHLLSAAAHLGLVVLALVLWRMGVGQSGWGVWAWWSGLPVVFLAIAWMDHAALTRLHEAAHSTLTRSRVLNECMGIVIGTVSLTPLSVYRYVHHQHHAYLAGPKDPEFWPYSLPGTSRALRLFYAAAELGFGWVVTPGLYSFRTACAWRTIPPVRRRRLVVEWALLVVVWVGVLVVVDVNGWWGWFLVGHVIPAWIAGTLQTIRKFTEHLGRAGDTILAMTRTVVYRGRVGRGASKTQLHVEHHATHHRWARLPWQTLPEATPIVYEHGDEGPVFPNHFAAVRDMLPHLLDPKVGPQWGELDR